MADGLDALPADAVPPSEVQETPPIHPSILATVAVLGPSGALARELPNYESRPQQFDNK
jgi:hypothetical protein